MTLGRCGASGEAEPALAAALAPPRAEIGLDLVDLFVGQAGQRRPLPTDTRLRADVNHRLAIKLQLLG